MLYHWIITVQFPNAGGFSVRTESGTLNVRRGETRYQVFEKLRAEVGGRAGAAGANTLFFSLELDALS